MLSVNVFVVWAAEIPGKEGKKNQLTNQQLQHQEIILKWHILHLKLFKIQVACRKKNPIYCHSWRNYKFQMNGNIMHQPSKCRVGYINLQECWSSIFFPTVMKLANSTVNLVSRRFFSLHGNCENCIFIYSIRI